MMMRMSEKDENIVVRGSMEDGSLFEGEEEEGERYKDLCCRGICRNG